PSNLQMLRRRQRNPDTRDNCGAAQHLLRTQLRPQPQPFNQRSERRCQALNQQQRKPRPQPRQCLKQRHVSNPDSDDPAQKEQRKRIPLRPSPESISPNPQNDTRAPPPPPT